MFIGDSRLRGVISIFVLLVDFLPAILRLKRASVRIGRRRIMRQDFAAFHELHFSFIQLPSQPIHFLSTYVNMPANTKYQAAPQRDSFDEPSPSYTQAPPSYQAQSSDPMLGGPRGEDDNIPDDFKVRDILGISNQIFGRTLTSL